MMDFINVPRPVLCDSQLTLITAMLKKNLLRIVVIDFIQIDFDFHYHLAVHEEHFGRPVYHSSAKGTILLGFQCQNVAELRV